MGQVSYSFLGINTRQLESSINNLRNSPTFRQIEADTSQRYGHVVIVMGPNVNPLDKGGLHRLPAVSGQASGDPGTLYIFLDTTTSATRPTPSGDLALTVDQLIAHEMAHATFPPRPFASGDLGGAPSKEDLEEEGNVVRLSNAVSADLGMTGTASMRGTPVPPDYKDNPGPLSTQRDPYAADPSILKFGNGARADVGSGPIEGAPTVGGAIYGIKRLGISGDTVIHGGPTSSFTQEASPTPPAFRPDAVNLPVSPPEAESPFGIFSGKPMPLWKTPPPIFDTRDRSDAAGDQNRFTTLGGLLWGGGKSKASALAAGAPAEPFALDGKDSFSNGAASPESGPGAGIVPPAWVAQQPQKSPASLIMDYIQRLRPLDTNPSRASTFDTGAPSVPFVSPDGVTGGPGGAPSPTPRLQNPQGPLSLMDAYLE
jgi:hypothetical protein